MKARWPMPFKDKASLYAHILTTPQWMRFICWFESYLFQMHLFTYKNIYKEVLLWEIYWKSRPIYALQVTWYFTNKMMERAKCKIFRRRCWLSITFQNPKTAAQCWQVPTAVSPWFCNFNTYSSHLCIICNSLQLLSHTTITWPPG